MKIFDKQGNIIENPNLEKGYLVNSTRPIIHRYEITQEEVGHYETIREYPNGGKDVEWAIDIPEQGEWITYDMEGNIIESDAIIPNDAPHEIEINGFETKVTYIPYTEEELEQRAKEERQPTQLDILEAQVTYTAMMTDTLLEV